MELCSGGGSEATDGIGSVLAVVVVVVCVGWWLVVGGWWLVPQVTVYHISSRPSRPPPSDIDNDNGIAIAISITTTSFPLPSSSLDSAIPSELPSTFSHLDKSH